MVIALDSRSTDPRFSCYPLWCRVQPRSSYSPVCACHPRLALFSLGNGVSREVNRHTMRHTVVQQLCLVSIWGLVNFISAPPYKPLSRKGPYFSVYLFLLLMRVCVLSKRATNVYATSFVFAVKHVSCWQTLYTLWHTKRTLVEIRLRFAWHTRTVNDRNCYESRMCSKRSSSVQLIIVV